MKYLIIVSLISSLVFGQECKVNETVVLKEDKEDVNTTVPKELEDGEIIVRTKDGKERLLKSNEFKVVKRKQQFKIKERVIIQKVECEPVIVKGEQTKNLIALGVRKDYIDLDKSVSGNTATVKKESGLVFDLNYYRRDLFHTRLGLGLGIDTNETVRGMVGLDF